jgi:signal transduction histidine kinase
MLSHDTQDLADTDTADICAEIDVNSQLLLGIINDILDMSRIDAGKVELNCEFVDLGDLAASLDLLTRALADRKGISYACDIAGDVPLLRADFDKLQHVFVNLLSNAVKFTPEGGTVSLKITFDGDTDEIVFAVGDSGIGIARENQKEIFDRFRQIDSSDSRKFGGTGLGLALVKEYTQMHNGTVEVASELGEGSTFTVRIPRQRGVGLEDHAD